MRRLPRLKLTPTALRLIESLSADGQLRVILVAKARATFEPWWRPSDWPNTKLHTLVVAGEHRRHKAH